MKKLLIVFSFLMVSFSLWAQHPETATTLDIPLSNKNNIVPFTGEVCGNWAGSCTQSLLSTAQSNDIEFLCLGDSLFIDHAEDDTLSVDPDAATTMGITYVFYDCAPTTSGTSLSDIADDPCTIQDLTDPANPQPFFVLSTFSDITIDGDANFVNTGALQSLVTLGGTGGPLELYFAPATIDDFDGGGYEGTAMNQSCIHVNDPNAFRVVYLNAITESNVVINNCNGSFTVEGGLPEFDGSSYPDISIVNSADNSIVGTVTSTPASHSETITFSVPSAGNYIISVEDDKSCGLIFTADLTGCSPPDLVVTLDSTAVSCNGGNSGQISVATTGTQTPFAVEWFDLPIDTSMGTSSISGSGGMMDIINLPAGDYEIVVTDNIGTVVTDTVHISEPALAFEVSIGTANDPTCFGLQNGSASLLFNNGQAPYDILWNNNATTDPLSNVGAGTYTVTVTDNIGCEDTATVTLVNPDTLVIDNITKQDALCQNLATGIATATSIGGTGAYTYTWSHDNTLTTNSAIGISEGTYFITVTDENLCTDTSSITINSTSEVAATATVSAISCPGVNDGSIVLNPTTDGVNGGNYSYNWSANTTATNNIASSLGVGTYVYVVTDNNTGCSFQDSVILAATASVTIDSVLLTDPGCILGNPEDNGTITIFASGGPAGSTYEYSIDNGVSFQPTNNYTNLVANTYNIVVQTATGCSSTVQAETLNALQVPQLIDIDTTNLTCASNLTGAVNVFVNPGSSAIVNYSWSNSISGQFETEITGLGAGQYDVTITDANNCFITAGALVTSPSALVFDAQPIVDRPCPGDNTGSIVLSVTGGTAPYSYNWDTGVSFTTDTLANISAGTYAVSVADANSCGPLVDTIIVSDPAPIGLTFQDIVPVLCDADTLPVCQGSTNLLANGGENPALVYSFNWENGFTEVNQFNSQPFSLCQGWNSVTVTDGFCTVEDSVWIPTPGQIEITDFGTTLPSCNKASDGTIEVTATGGAGNYIYYWSTNDTTNNLNTIGGLVAGSYGVTITDINNCPADTLTIIVPEKDTLILEIIDTINVGCFGATNGSIVSLATGGNAANGYTFNWSHDASLTTNIATGLDTGYYFVTAVDSLGCSDTASAIIVEPIPLVVNLDAIEEPACFGYTTVISIDTAFGGNGAPYFYTVDGFNYQNITKTSTVFADTYNMTIVDASNCRVDTTIIISEPLEVLVDLGPDIEIQLGENTQLEALPEAVFGVDSIAWTFPEYLSCPDCLRPVATPPQTTTFEITIWDDNGCSGSDQIEVEIDKNRNVFIPNVFSPNDDSHNEYFRPFVGAGVERITTMQVFNRWGALIYDQKDFLPNSNSLGWNGTINGEDAPTGVYLYLIEVAFQDGRVLLYKGETTLLR